MADSLHALAGIFGLLCIAFLLGENRRAVPWRAVIVGVVLQVLLAFLFLKISFFREVFIKLNDVLIVLEKATQAGTSLVFG
jgi:CNT family concentrative nucleoside transporter